MKKYPSIEQFRNVIKAVRSIHDYRGKDENGLPIYEHKENYPVLKFQGTVKLHGTNSGIVKYSDGRIEFQSRERVLTLQYDNAGFMATMIDKNLEFIFESFPHTDFVAVFGEWCGGNIQKGVAINGLDKMFVIFGVMVDDGWVALPRDLHDNANGIYNVLQFPAYEVEVDFNHPELVQNNIIELTNKVEESCPVGLFFNRIGTGEGVVFTCTTNPDLKFKSKGEKHSVTKVRTLNPVDVELLEDVNEFVSSTVTENRLMQGISYFKENNIKVDAKNTGQFLSWIVKDVLKEEKDTLELNGLDEKLVKNGIVTRARMWYLNSI